ncbi:hypothetical protein [Vibrio harveyi]|uniref:hypothetical protein n=1 Tax=Vibrio harveyi TaxID=669 RepID=UPI001263BA16|nr:hypothetical protein [Vibrio harveyi]QFQ76881.1 hypothetical protein F9277_05135 [Vibrio harveyi]
MIANEERNFCIKYAVHVLSKQGYYCTPDMFSIVDANEDKVLTKLEISIDTEPNKIELTIIKNSLSNAFVLTLLESTDDLFDAIQSQTTTSFDVDLIQEYINDETPNEGYYNEIHCDPAFSKWI